MPKATKKKVTEKQVVYAAARRHSVPGWLLWGVYGAENSFTYGNGVPFGLIENNYPQLNGGKGRTFQNKGLPEAADIAAELLSTLKKEHGSWAGAISAYSGGEYSISHPKELARQNKGQGNTVNVSLLEEAFGNTNIPGTGISPNTLGGIGESLTHGILKEGVEAVGEVTGLKPISEFFIGLGQLILTPQGWLRMAKLIGGAILALWGLRIVIRESSGSDPVHAGVSTVKKGADLAALAATIK